RAGCAHHRARSAGRAHPHPFTRPTPHGRDHPGPRRVQGHPPEEPAEGRRRLPARRAINAAKSSPSIDRVIVSTDHEGIAAEALRTGAEVSHRPAEIAGDTATSESALIHTLSTL